jgi:hypothetical protein
MSFREQWGRGIRTGWNPHWLHCQWELEGWVWAVVELAATRPGSRLGHRPLSRDHLQALEVADGAVVLAARGRGAALGDGEEVPVLRAEEGFDPADDAAAEAGSAGGAPHVRAPVRRAGSRVPER